MFVLIIFFPVSNLVLIWFKGIMLMTIGSLVVLIFAGLKNKQA